MSNFDVPFVTYGKAYKKIKKEIDEAIQYCLTHGDLILRKDVTDFEKSLADYLGIKYAIGVNSGTDALTIALISAGVKTGDEVITSAHTFWGTIEAILHAGAKPVLVGINDDLLLDLKEAKTKVNVNTKAIIPVHLAGNVCNMTEVMQFAKDWNLKVIEDACQAIGAKHENKFAGTFGNAGCFSFYPAKILGAYGDAGAIVTDDPKIAANAVILRNHGSMGKLCLGYNSRLDNIQAAVLNVKLKYLNDYIKRRKEIALIYDGGLNGIDSDYLTIPETRDVYQDYIVKAPTYWLNLKQHLERDGIEIQVDHYDFPENYIVPDSVKHLQAIRLPISPDLTDEQIQYVIQCIHKFYDTNNTEE